MKDNDNQPIFLAKISAFGDKKDEHGCPLEARVIPDTTPDVVSRLFPILWICRGNLGKLEVSTPVVCARFPDGTGIILCRADGEHTNIFPDGLRVEGKATVDETLTANDDVIGGGKSLKGHTHTGVHGVTSPPN